MQSTFLQKIQNQVLHEKKIIKQIKILANKNIFLAEIIAKMNI